jgi:hypothetical protein
MSRPNRSRNRSGTEPDTARTAPRLRLTLAAFGLVLFGLLAAVFFVDAGEAGGGRGVALTAGILSSVIAATAVADLVLLTRRLRRGDYR